MEPTKIDPHHPATIKRLHEIRTKVESLPSWLWEGGGYVWARPYIGEDSVVCGCTEPEMAKFISQLPGQICWLLALADSMRELIPPPGYDRLEEWLDGGDREDLDSDHERNPPSPETGGSG